MNHPNLEDARREAVEWWMRLQAEAVDEQVRVDFQRWLDADPAHEPAYRQVSVSWNLLDDANDPLLGRCRREALENAQQWQEQRKRAWYRPLAGVAAAALIALVAGGAWQYSQRNVYETRLGERRSVTLEDGSILTLDSRSRARVDFHARQRHVVLEEGQARFDVAKDPWRPFRVDARNQTVTALGTQFNVDIVASTVLVTMIEGRVGVSGAAEQTRAAEAVPPDSNVSKRDEAAQSAAQPVAMIELAVGDGLHVNEDGLATRIPHVDVERVTAWQVGKVFFEDEPLSSAAERMNRYSKLQIEVDPTASNASISGIFDAANAAAFVDAVATYFPVDVQRTGDWRVRISGSADE